MDFHTQSLVGVLEIRYECTQSLVVDCGHTIFSYRLDMNTIRDTTTNSTTSVRPRAGGSR
jgi:hypothetical protein